MSTRKNIESPITYSEMGMVNDRSISGLKRKYSENKHCSTTFMFSNTKGTNHCTYLLLVASVNWYRNLYIFAKTSNAVRFVMFSDPEII